MEQYLTMIPGNQAPGMVKPKIGANHDGSSSRDIDSSSNSKGIVAIVNKLDRLGRDMKKLKENMQAIQVGCQTYEGAHLEKECPLKEDVKSIKEVKYGEFGRPFLNNSRNDGRLNRGASGYDQPSLGERRPSLTKIINKYMEEEAKRHAEQDKWFLDNEKQEINKSEMEKALAELEAKLEIKKHHAEEALIHETMESLKKIKINRPLLKEIRQTDDYTKHMKNLVANKPRTKEEEVRMDPS
ncbi:hypothetical protein Tco_0550159 [Tanacetum coccineum]